MPVNPLQREALEPLLRRWDEATSGLEPESPSVPIHVLLGDAVDLAAFVEAHYEPTLVSGKLRPGLSSVEAQSGITRATALELRELQAAISFVQSKIDARGPSAGEDPLREADRIVSELRAALSFLLEGGDAPEGAAALRRLREAYRGTRAHDAVALILERYAELGARHLSALESIGVDRGLLDGALAEARELRARSATRIERRASPDEPDLLVVRNRLVAALQARMRKVRAAVRYVFRAHPELARTATSAYHRARRGGAPAEPGAERSAPEANGPEANGPEAIEPLALEAAS